MAERAATAEANRSDSRAVARGKHGSRAARPRQCRSPVVLRRPIQYSAREVELLLELLWGMFTESQAHALEVQVPWDEGGEEPQQIGLADLAAQMERWLA